MLAIILCNAMYVSSTMDFINWKTQIRKGYLELCLLALIRGQGKLYGFDIIEQLKKLGFHIKEGTLYPILNRMTLDGILSAEWETQNLKGHPRKFYSLTAQGESFFTKMAEEFQDMINLFSLIKNHTGELYDEPKSK